MEELKCQLVVIGAGPGGYVCAIRAGQLGLDTVIVDASELGGTCLNVGCIPSKALIHAADEFHAIKDAASGSRLGISLSQPVIDLGKTVAWKNGIVGRLTGGVGGLLKKAGVRHIRGRAKFLDGKSVEVETDRGRIVIRAGNAVIATGSRPAGLPGLPFGDTLISSTEALSLTEVPKRLAIVGGGYIGLEIGTAYAKLGSKVTVIEAAAKILPQYDADLCKPVVQRLEVLGVDVLTNARAREMSVDCAHLVVEADGERKIEVDKVLIAAGRQPVTDGWGLDELQLGMNGKFIAVDDTCRTSMRGVYAIGDVTGEPMLAHRAMAQGEMVAEIIAGQKRSWDKMCIPAVCFTDPEIVVVGALPQEARDRGVDIKVADFPFKANGRSMTMQRDDGFVRVVARADNHVILGIQAVGAAVSELSAGFSLAIEMGARVEDIAGTIHAHPTQSEAVQEAALRILGNALHV